MQQITKSKLKKLGLPCDESTFLRNCSVTLDEFRNFANYIAHGSHAVVLSNKSDTNTVIRCYMTGDRWLEYAIRAKGRKHAPFIHSTYIAYGLYLSIVEKLSPCRYDPAYIDLLCTAVNYCANSLKDKGSTHPSAMWLLANEPSVYQDVVSYLDGANDVRPENIMMRKNTLILNDPYC